MGKDAFYLIIAVAGPPDAMQDMLGVVQERAEALVLLDYKPAGGIALTTLGEQIQICQAMFKEPPRLQLNG
jgi:hypothetical protein